MPFSALSLARSSQRHVACLVQHGGYTFKPPLRTSHVISHSSRVLIHQYSTQKSESCSALHDIRDLSRGSPLIVFESSSSNPYYNLAIENYILRNSDPSSRILLFYTNRPCVVFGRNQNPWLECDIARIKEGLRSDYDKHLDGDIQKLSDNRHAVQGKSGPQIAELIPLDLVRRRSGGGTVVHDVGNLNYSVIVPNDKDFTRTKHAQMIVDALLSREVFNGFESYRHYAHVRVNERHDIVMHKPDSSGRDLKVSGSAYKLTRGRALHHGTLLHSSPNLGPKIGTASEKGFGRFLNSPAKGFLDAKGVGSVPSPVHNLFNVTSGSVRDKIRSTITREMTRQFRQSYDAEDDQTFLVGDSDCDPSINPDIALDAAEMLTDEWRFEQTPGFEYHNWREEDHGEKKKTIRLNFFVKNGIIQRSTCEVAEPESMSMLVSSLDGQVLHRVNDWNELLQAVPEADREGLVGGLIHVFPNSRLVDSDSVPATPKQDMTVTSRSGISNTITIRRDDRSGRVEVESPGTNVVEQHVDNSRGSS